MKKGLHLFVFVCAIAVLASCGKSKETLEAEATAKADSIAAVETKKADERAAKHASFTKLSAEKAEQRKLAAAEKAKLSPTYKDASGKIVYYKAEQDPMYTGGDSEMNKYLHDNLKYPQSAIDAGIEGTVFVDFIVDEKGMVRDVVAADAVGNSDEVDASLKDEAVRVVKTMPAWMAGRHKGKPVETAYSLPITFSLDH